MIFSKTFASLATLASMLALAQADMLQISNPTQGTRWKVGETVFLEWKGNCASMGSAAKNVDVDLMTGNSNALRFVAKLASIDCSASNNRKEFVIPADVVKESGIYSLAVQTVPQLSYSNVFTIDSAVGAGDGGVTAETPGAGGQAGTTPGQDPNTKNSGAAQGTVTAATAVAMAAVAFAAQLL
ncbi:hypothetical protein BG006_002447 [Podila minutissima]|uniref:Yeast cell wall synthesis Kre9/Knh1-like N-terminal domain-containing protein n=1 Tax=Podila minutissima TaxID=64525 RepID=A0A9P5VGM2_9FUNG|nr:hypothetical protein BG006_002447 [Podila minutissima]